ncbi:alpha/beta hydrolase family protein [Desertihabitans aurantiacus]|uniref:alpha/beta hydrolase family protein n=1 Tax=Desertihabitans aurantiacus TaxID=2282477 RepID=UPI000DF76722|nr:hypothetical protein [Desertihabitans aurantiacus]
MSSPPTVVKLEDFTHHPDLPFHLVPDVHDWQPPSELGVTKYRSPVGRGADLEALLLNQGSEVLLVSLHGATNRETVTLPRFERLRTFRGMPYSSLYFADPALQLDEGLTLAWYTGWEDLPLPDILADWVSRAAAAVGARKVVFMGGSGGGFACLQVSPRVPGSVAIPINPQTAIPRYVPGGSWRPARNYIRTVMPHLTPPEGLEAITTEWGDPAGDRLNVVERYRTPQPNRVLYVQNLNDHTHIGDHYELFRRAVAEAGVEGERVRYFEYDGPHRHAVPDWELTSGVLRQALAWLDEPGRSRSSGPDEVADLQPA